MRHADVSVSKSEVHFQPGQTRALPKAPWLFWVCYPWLWRVGFHELYFWTVVLFKKVVVGAFVEGHRDATAKPLRRWLFERLVEAANAGSEGGRGAVEATTTGGNTGRSRRRYTSAGVIAPGGRVQTVPAAHRHCAGAEKAPRSPGAGPSSRQTARSPTAHLRRAAGSPPISSTASAGNEKSRASSPA